MIKPYLLFHGKCDEAVNMYVNAFDGEIVSMMKYSDIPSSAGFTATEDNRNLVIHTCIKIADGFIFASDSQSEKQPGTMMSISVELDSEEVARKAWDILKEDGEVLMDLSSHFFADLHGTVRDKYGVTWMFTIGQN